jgi:hypothetical protein
VTVDPEKSRYEDERQKRENRNSNLKEEDGWKRTETECKERTLMTDILSKTMEMAVAVDRRHWEARRINTKGMSEV